MADLATSPTPRMAPNYGLAPYALLPASPTAITQTYSTTATTVATPTAATPTAAALTDSSGGTSGGGTIAAIGAAVDPTAALKTDTANAVATLAAMVNKLTADLLVVTKVLNTVIDGQQAAGIAT